MFRSSGGTHRWVLRSLALLARFEYTIIHNVEPLGAVAQEL
jgi:hypothetical protein